MCDNFPDFDTREAVIHGPVEVIGDLRNLTRGDQRTYGDQAAIARCKTRPEPKVAEQDIGRVLNKPWCYRTELLSDTSCALSLRRLIERKELRRRARQLV